MIRLRLDLFDRTERPAAPVPEDPNGEIAREFGLRSEVFKTHLEKSYAFASAASERYKSAASTVQTASSALLVIYTGGLALVFGEGEENLPARGLLTPAFLALAVILSSVYLAYQAPRLSTADDFPQIESASTMLAEGFLNSFRERILALVTDRLWALHGSVIALAAAFAMAAAPFTGSQPQSVAPEDVDPDWPTPPVDASAAELAKYQAQLDEIAALREAALAGSREFISRIDWWWFGAAAVLLALVFLPWFRRKLKRHDAAQEPALPPPA